MADVIVKLLILVCLCVPVLAYGMPVDARIGSPVTRPADVSIEPADPLDSNAAFLRR